ncbi:MAG TPA: hypothetical protein PLE60_09755 [Candidatus Latescibacteria bacterium]|nr:hypothetical protein [Candidatus Latescibacterota bacterium]
MNTENNRTWNLCHEAHGMKAVPGSQRDSITKNDGGGMSRREFIALGASAALGMVVTTTRGWARPAREARMADSRTGARMRLHEAYWINGVPVLGAFNVRSLEDLQIAHQAGFNMAAYAHLDMLDPDTPMGRYALDNGLKAMHSITGPTHGSPRLARAIDARETTIPFESGAKPAPGPGVVVIEDERIRYRDSTENSLTGCERGADGTEAKPHRALIIMFWPEPFALEIAKVKDSPNLWGYWALDDTPGYALSAMRGLTSVVHEVDGRHPVCGGYSGPDTMFNFGPGACDIIVPYWYPVLKWGYDRQMTSMDTQAILVYARRQVPGIPFMGLYQAFWGADWNKRGPLTAFEIREQAEDFVREGAAGLMGFAVLHQTNPNDIFGGFNLDPEMTRAVREINDEVRRTCALTVPPERPEMAAIRIRPIGFQAHEPEPQGIPPAWRIAFPFEAGESGDLDTSLAPDAGIDLTATYVGKDGEQLSWKTIGTRGGVIAFLDLIGPVKKAENTIGYAVCTVTSSVERTVQVRLGAAKDTLVRVNGKEIWRYTGSRGIHLDDNVAWTTLPAGKSEIVVKCYNRGGGWGFALRFADPDGRPAAGLSFEPAAG